MTKPEDLPSALHGQAGITCFYTDVCPIHKRHQCPYVKTVIAAEVFVDPTAEDIEDAMFELADAMRAWADHPEPDCTLTGNVADGEPISVARSSGYFIIYVH